MRGLIGSSIQRTLSSQLFCPRLSYVRRFRMLIHTKGGMVRFQRAYHHGCSPTSIIRAQIPHLEYAKGYMVPFKGNLFPRLLCCPCSVKRMGVVSIMNGNAWGRFRGCWHERFMWLCFLQVH